MRLWTLHPKYLDARGLVALWREALLAQEVLAGRTRGYRAHPQLLRFRAHPDPLAAIGAFLAAVHDEAVARSYRFDASRIECRRAVRRIPETTGQLQFEREHLAAKLRLRDPARGRRLAKPPRLDPHPLFRLVAGGVREWEKRGAARGRGFFPWGAGGGRSPRAPPAPRRERPSRRGETRGGSARR